MSVVVEIDYETSTIKLALNRVHARLSDLSPAMREIGELLVERAKQRFATSTAPDGTRWAPNAPATIMAYLSRYGGTRRKDGGLTKRGAARAAAKKPLIGETKQLMGTLHYRYGRDWVTVGSPMVYAAIHQWGGKAGRGKRVPVPARPFLPVTASGGWLGDGDRRAALDVLREALEDALSV